MRSSSADGRSRVRDAADAVRAFQLHWSSGRRALVPAGLIAAIATVGLSALLAAGGDPTARSAAAATPRHRPDYLLPLGVLLEDGSLPEPALTGDRGNVGVPPGTPTGPTTPSAGTAARQAPAIARYQGPAGTLTPAGIATLALEHGCDPDAAVISTAIAMAESGGSPSAQGDIGLMTSTWDWSAGLWQIRGLRAERNTGGLRDSVANQDVDKNAAAMSTISQGCTDWTPWSTYNTRAYQPFMPLARAAVRYVVAYYRAHGHYPPVPAPDPSAAIPSQGTGSAAAQARAGTGGSTSTARRTAAPRTGGSSTGGGSPPASTTAAATSPERSTSSSPAGGPLPVPSTTLPTETTSLPLPLPTTTLPLPLPTATLPLVP